MNRRKNAIVSARFNALAAIFATFVVVTMFLSYVSADLLLLKTTRTGFKLLDYDGAMGRPYLVFSIILSIGLVAFSILRLVRFPLFNTRLLSAIFAIAGIALLVVSVILMFQIVKVKIGGSTAEVFDRGVGVILNLVFSFIVAIACIGSNIAADDSI